MKKGIFIGLSTIDLIYYIDHHPLSNEKMIAFKQLSCAGGPATNAAVTFSFFKNNSLLISGLGKSNLNNIFLKDIGIYDVSYMDLISDINSEPPISSIYVKLESGERSVVSVNASNKILKSELITPELFDSAKILLIDGHFMESCIHSAKIARDMHIPVVLDGGSWKSGNEELLPLVDYAICSESFRPPNCSNVNERIDYLKNCGISNVAITRGQNSIIAADKNAKFDIPIDTTGIVDTLGAGDIFHGAFCHFITENIDFKNALCKSSEIASLSCKYYGTREWTNHL